MSFEERNTIVSNLSHGRRNTFWDDPMEVLVVQYLVEGYKRI